MPLVPVWYRPLTTPVSEADALDVFGFSAFRYGRRDRP
jgi:hypothetical protein